MENNSVEITAEPKINSRFGFEQKNKFATSRTAKIGAAVSAISLVIVFLLKSPTPNSNTNNGITVPDSSKISTNYTSIEIKEYSATEESIQLKQKFSAKRSDTSVKFPGLQKIARKRSGEIPLGTIVKAVLTTGATNGTVKAKTLEPIRAHGETFLASGTILLGVGQSGEERLSIRFSKAIHNDGSVENIQAQAADSEDQTVGLKGSRLGKYATKYAAAVGLNFVGGMAEGLQDWQIVGDQVVSKPSARNALLNGASKATIEMANETMTDLQNSAPVIHVPAGSEILVMFDGNL